MPKPNRKEAGSFSGHELQKLQRLYIQGGAAYGSLCISVKPSHLPVPKVRQFLHSKRLYTKITLATPNVKRVKAFAKIRNKIWCLYLASVDKLVKDENGVKNRLLHQICLIKA